MLPSVHQLSALLSVVIIDVVLAGDNAVVIGMAAAGVDRRHRRRVICLGIAAATALRIFFAYFTAELLDIIGLTLAGGILLLWVCWKMYRELRYSAAAATAGGCDGDTPVRRGSSTRALTRIVLADLSMSLDNVLAVAGTARVSGNETWVLAFGLILSVALTGIASTYIARLLDRHFWISWVGLGIITFVAGVMIWKGSAEILHQTAMLSLPGLWQAL